MKKASLLISILVLTIASSFSQLSQASNEQISAYQDAFGKDKRVIVSTLIQLHGEDSITFWGIYDKLQLERKEFGLKRIELYKEYKAEYESLNDESTNKIVKEMMQIVAKDNKMIIKHHSQIDKALGGIIAGQYYQIEMYLQATIRQFYFNQLEFIGAE